MEKINTLFKKSNNSSVSIPKRKKTLFVRTKSFKMKSGNYLSSQRLTVSTFGVKELNFCVRNGNRWILFAIITAIAIYFVSSRLRYIYLFKNLQKVSSQERLISIFYVLTGKIQERQAFCEGAYPQRSVTELNA